MPCETRCVGQGRHRFARDVPRVVTDCAAHRPSLAVAVSSLPNVDGIARFSVVASATLSVPSFHRWTAQP